MAMSPEQETKTQQPVSQDVREIPEVPEVPAHIERGGVAATPTQVTTQVTDDAGQPMMQSPQTQQVSITLPTDQSQIQDWSKGDPNESRTWLGMFWWRMIQKALHFGWKIFKREGGGDAAS